MVTGLETDGLEIYTVIMGTTAADRFQNMKIQMCIRDSNRTGGDRIYADHAELRIQ